MPQFFKHNKLVLARVKYLFLIPTFEELDYVFRYLIKPGVVNTIDQIHQSMLSVALITLLRSKIVFLKGGLISESFSLWIHIKKSATLLS